MSNPTEPVVAQFGTGRLVVGTATSSVLPDAHLVVINPAVEPGPVGETAHEREERSTFRGDEIIFAFPTFEQASRVADALCNNLPSDAAAADILRRLYPIVKDMDDEGPRGARWQSDEFMRALADARALLEPEQ